MAKIKVLKKIAALVTAIALIVCFAVSASAVEVLTSTTYADNGEVRVAVTVTDVDPDANVTYYATRTIEGVVTPVHIDQTKAIGTTATFEFNTDEANLLSEVKVGSTGTAATGSIEGYTVICGGQTRDVVNADDSYTLQFTYDRTEGKKFKDVSVQSGNALTNLSSSEDNGTITVTFTGITSDVTLQVNEEDDSSGAVTAEASLIGSAGIVVKANTDYSQGIKMETIYDDNNNVDTDSDNNANANADKVGDRKLTVIGKVSVSEGKRYGVIVTTGNITTGTISADDFAALSDKTYAGATKGSDGVFAVQLIDTSSNTEGTAFIEVGDYNTAIYAEDDNGSFVISEVSVATVE